MIGRLRRGGRIQRKPADLIGADVEVDGRIGGSADEELDADRAGEGAEDEQAEERIGRGVRRAGELAHGQR